MRALLAIAQQTVRSSLRSHVFHVLLGLILLAVFLLPVTVAGDGTAMGQLQISLTYSLGVVTVLVSMATLWLSCAVLSREIEGYQMHMVTTKPAPRWLVWLGKWLGVFTMHAFLFLVAAGIILVLVRWRVENGNFPEAELEQLRNEVLVGRQVYEPEQPNFARLMNDEYDTRLKGGTLDPAHDRQAVLTEILRQIKARSTEVGHELTRGWRFSKVRVAGPEAPVFLRYRMYVGSAMSSGDQRFTDGMWGVLDPTAQEAGTFAVLPQRAMGGAFHEMVFPGAMVDSEGAVVAAYTNQDAEKSAVVFQIADGPTLMVARTGFVSNYFRSAFLVVLELAFLTALGCTVGALFSTPVAIFAALSYLVIGLSVHAALAAPLPNELGGYEYKNVAERLAHYLAIGVSKVVVTVDDFDATSDLAKGRLIEGLRMAKAMCGLILLRSAPLALLGIYLFSKRELGTVIRR